MPASTASSTRRGCQEDTIDQFARQGIAIVPTLVNIANFPAVSAPAAEKFPAYHQHMLDLHARRHATIGAAHEAGIPIFVGTDAGGSLPHGLVAGRWSSLTRQGSRRSRLSTPGSGRPGIGSDAPASRKGEDADFVVYGADPGEDVTVVAEPKGIVLRGRLVR